MERVMNIGMPRREESKEVKKVGGARGAGGN